MGAEHLLREVELSEAKNEGLSLSLEIDKPLLRELRLPADTTRAMAPVLIRPIETF
jgi:hypothetical protein